MESLLFERRREEAEEEYEEEMMGVDLQPRQTNRYASEHGENGSGNGTSEKRHGVKGRDGEGRSVIKEAGVGEVDVVEEEEEEEEKGLPGPNKTDERDITSTAGAEIGNETTNGIPETENVKVACHLSEIGVGDGEVLPVEKDYRSVSKSTFTAIARGLEEIPEKNGSCSFNFQPTQVSNGKINTVNEVQNNGEVHRTALLKRGELVALSELDVERVIENQETHDLFCPNCNSCITKRVILRRRKRKIQDISIAEDTSDVDAPKYTTPEICTGVQVVAFGDSAGEEETGPDFFRCLSCFSIFVPSGKKVEDKPHGIAQVGTTEAAASDTITVSTTRTDSVIEQGSVFKFWFFGDKKPDEPIHSSDGLSAGESTANKLATNMMDEEIVKGEDVVIRIPERPVEPEASETRPRSDDVSAETPLLQGDTAFAPIATPQGAQAGAFTSLDVLKAIVYGGLLESITSLSIVTSAVSAGASTLNVLALGVANLIGGLLVLAHNLRVLRYETVARYEEQLGRTGSFALHATVAVLSYLVFGLLPPTVYGFSFCASNNRDLKLVALVSSSLLCIIFLSFTKAHVRSPPKHYIKTLTYYLSLWITVCGGSYLVGDLLRLLIEKLGWFDSEYSLVMTVPEGGVAKLI